MIIGRSIKKWRYISLVGLLLVMTGCATAPRFNQALLSFYPDDFDLLLQWNIPRFRPLIREMARLNDDSSWRNIEQLMRFTGQISGYQANQLRMMRLIGFYPKNRILRMLRGLPSSQARAIDEQHFLLPSANLELFVPRSNEIFLASLAESSIIERIERQQEGYRTATTLPARVEQALRLRHAFVLYVTDANAFFPALAWQERVPVAIPPFLIEIEVISRRRYAMEIIFFTDNAQQRGLLAATVRAARLLNMHRSELEPLLAPMEIRVMNQQLQLNFVVDEEHFARLLTYLLGGLP